MYLVIRRVFCVIMVFVTVIGTCSFAPESEEEGSQAHEIFVEDVLLQCLEDYTMAIDLSKHKKTVSEVSIVYQKLLESHPQLYFVSPAFTYTYDKDGYLVVLYPKYNMSLDMLKSSREEFLEFLQEVQKQATLYGSEGDKALFIYDLLINSFTYSPAGSENYDAYRLISEGHGVCQAFSMLFIALGRCLGLSCHMVTSEAMDHAWNHVRIDGNYYHIDVTRDLPSEGRQTEYRRFLLCDQGMQDLNYYDYTCHEEHTCYRHDYEVIADDTGHVSMIAPVSEIGVFIRGKWLCMIDPKALFLLDLRSDAQQDEKSAAQIDLDGDGQESLTDMLILLENCEEKEYPDLLRKKLMEAALEEYTDDSLSYSDKIFSIPIF